MVWYGVNWKIIELIRSVHSAKCLFFYSSNSSNYLGAKSFVRPLPLLLHINHSSMVTKDRNQSINLLFKRKLFRKNYVYCIYSSSLVRKELEHRNHLLAELTGQHHVPLAVAVANRLAYAAVAVLVTVGKDRGGGLRPHEAHAVAVAAIVVVVDLLVEHPVDDGCAAVGLAKSGGGGAAVVGPDHRAAGRLEQRRGRHGGGGQCGGWGIPTAGVEVLVVKELGGSEVGPLGWCRGAGI